MMNQSIEIEEKWETSGTIFPVGTVFWQEVWGEKVEDGIVWNFLTPGRASGQIWLDERQVPGKS